MEKKVKASPTKEFFVSMLVRDILLKQAIIELIDNSLDGARKARRGGDFDGLAVEVEFNEDRFLIRDNCGGIPLSVAEEYAFRFGRPTTVERGNAETTGIFGIGMKRALFKMGENIVIKSKTVSSDFQVTIDVNEWLSPEKVDWDFNFDFYNDHQNYDIAETGTIIEVTKLHSEISGELSDPDFEKELIDHVERRVGLDIVNGVEILINGKKLVGNNVKIISCEEMMPVKETYTDLTGVKVDIIAGIAPKEGNKYQPENAGWYIYCNGRLIVAADKTSLTTWKDMENKSSDVAFHNSFASFRGLVMFSAENPSLLPWNTTKTGIDSTSLVYLRAKEKMLEIFKIVKGFFDEAKTYYNDNGDDGLDLSLEKMSTVEITKSTKDNEVKTNRTMTIKSITIDPNPSVTITYKKPKSEVDRIKGSLDVSTNKDVGIRTFEYYLDAEC